MSMLSSISPACAVFSLVMLNIYSLRCQHTTTL